MYAVEFETINHNGMIKIPEEYGFAENESIKVIILKKEDSSSHPEFKQHREEIKNLIDDYKTNGDKNFILYEEGMDTIDNWLDGLNIANP